MVSVVHPTLGDENGREQAFGSVTARIQGRFAVGTPPPGTATAMLLSGLLNTMSFLLRTRLKGQHMPSPSGASLAEAVILTVAERDALRQLCGSKL